MRNVKPINSIASRIKSSFKPQQFQFACDKPKNNNNEIKYLYQKFSAIMVQYSTAIYAHQFALVTIAMLNWEWFASRKDWSIQKLHWSRDNSRILTFPIMTAFVKSNSSGLISQSALFVRGGGIDFASKWLPVFPCSKNESEESSASD